MFPTSTETSILPPSFDCAIQKKLRWLIPAGCLVRCSLALHLARILLSRPAAQMVTRHNCDWHQLI